MNIGDQLPEFNLPDTVTNRNWNMSEISSDRATLVIFMCNHCPFVKRVEESIANLGKIYTDQIAIIAISPSDPGYYPDDAPQYLKEQAEKLGFNFPYFYDDRQEVAKKFDVKFMPDFFLFSQDKKLIYHGQIDDTRPSNNLISDAKDLKSAIDAVLYNNEVSKEQKASEGCEIKWK